MIDPINALNWASSSECAEVQKYHDRWRVRRYGDGMWFDGETLAAAVQAARDSTIDGWSAKTPAFVSEEKYEDIRHAMVVVLGHTARNPGYVSVELTSGLLDSIERIARETLKRHPGKG